MTIKQSLQLWFEKAILSEEDYTKLKTEEETRPISLHWEINILLMAGIGFLTTGLGILVYKNIDTIGHKAIIAAIALATAACGWYVVRHRLPFLWQEQQKARTLPDNILLLGCSLFLILEGYLQYQYQIFGTRYGLATLIPAVLFFFCAYRFDHIGVLTMGMTALVSWAGLTVTPLSIFKEDVFQAQPLLIHTGIIMGIVLIVMGLVFEHQRIKPHFTFSYLNFGFNLASIATLYGAVSLDKNIYCLLGLVLAALGILHARRSQSYFFLLASTIYGYIALTILIAQLDFSFEIWLLYGMVTCLGIVLFILNFKKLLK
ncbi:MAG: DUF2157 domain-containing protein [Saprospiraceae bacterium]|nr:DUF2157 domain-containing protein [Saprospiraceae bacterium]